MQPKSLPPAAMPKRAGPSSAPARSSVVLLQPGVALAAHWSDVQSSRCCVMLSTGGSRRENRVGYDRARDCVPVCLCLCHRHLRRRPSTSRSCSTYPPPTESIAVPSVFRVAEVPEAGRFTLACFVSQVVFGVSPFALQSCGGESLSQFGFGLQVVTGYS